MFYPQNESHSEVQRDQLFQAHRAYWSALPQLMAEPDRQAWEAGSPIHVKAGPWVWVVLAIVIALSLFLSVVI